MPDYLKLQNEPVTQAMFDRMPALMTAFQTKLVTGFDDRELADAVAAKRIKIWRRPVASGRKKSYNKYTKMSVAQVTGFTV